MATRIFFIIFIFSTLTITFLLISISAYFGYNYGSRDIKLNENECDIFLTSIKNNPGWDTYNGRNLTKLLIRDRNIKESIGKKESIICFGPHKTLQKHERSIIFVVEDEDTLEPIRNERTFILKNIVNCGLHVDPSKREIGKFKAIYWKEGPEKYDCYKINLKPNNFRFGLNYLINPSADPKMLVSKFILFICTIVIIL